MWPRTFSVSAYERYCCHGVKIVMVFFNAMVGKKRLLGQKSRNSAFALGEIFPKRAEHEARKMFICSIKFQWKKIHWASWFCVLKNTNQQAKARFNIERCNHKKKCRTGFYSTCAPALWTHSSQTRYKRSISNSLRTAAMETIGFR